ncbi:hypothetical protein COB72_11215 [bacterium]|nr:MAG: hypothetical protein COB72_11215 [bacterium]
MNARFARDVYASRASILIIGDSTNNPRGAGAFVPYYEGFIQTLPEEIELCGFRVSGSTGNTGVNNYIKFGGGANSQMEGNTVFQRSEGIPVGNTGHSPPGYRNEFTIIDGGVMPSAGRFASIGFVNLEGIYPYADQWIQDATLVIRTPFFTTPDDTMLTEFSMALLNDHAQVAGLNVYAFSEESVQDIVLTKNQFGLEFVDAIFDQPLTSRIGVRFAGDLDTDDANESGKRSAWADNILFDQSRAMLDTGIYWDSISIGGYTARDHAESLDPLILDDYFAMAPRQFRTILVWLGQNALMDEWNGIVQPVWIERIEAIADLAIQAAIDSGASYIPVPILITSPMADGDYPSVRFSAMSVALEEIANRRGWGHIDIHALVGSSLTSIDASFDGPGPHPSQAASLYLGELFYNHLNCLRAEFTGDELLNFFDISAFLTLFVDQDPDADFNGDGVHNFFDISAFLTAFSADCP